MTWLQRIKQAKRRKAKGNTTQYFSESDCRTIDKELTLYRELWIAVFNQRIGKAERLYRQIMKG